jgi:hypothetical protein
MLNLSALEKIVLASFLDNSQSTELLSTIQMLATKCSILREQGEIHLVLLLLWWWQEKVNPAVQESTSFHL